MNDDLPVQTRITPLIEDMDPLEQIMREIEVDLEANGWDQPPSFWLIMRSEGLGMCAFTIQMPSQVYFNPGIFFPPFVEFLKRSPYAGEMLSRIRQAINGITPVIGQTVDLYAAGNFHEAWAIISDEPMTPELEKIFQDRMVFAHPDRVEQRTGTFVTVDGEYALVARSRGEAPEFGRVSTWEQTDMKISGSMPEALHDFLALLTVDTT